MNLRNTFLKSVVTSDNSTLMQLLEGGFNPNFETFHGSTPLHYAIKYGELYTVKLLLDYNSDPNALNSLGYSPLFYAIQVEATEAVFNCDIYNDCSNPRATKTKLLLEKGATPEDLFERGDLIYYARSCGHEEAIMLLKQHDGIDPKESSEYFDIICRQCQRHLSKMINGNYQPSESEIKEAGAFFVPYPKCWFCSQECAGKYETQHNIRFPRDKEGAIDY